MKGRGEGDQEELRSLCPIIPTSVSVIQPIFDVLKPVHTVEDNSVKGAFETAILPPICRGGFEINCCSATNRRTVANFHAKPAQAPHRGPFPKVSVTSPTPPSPNTAVRDSSVAMFAAILHLFMRCRGSQRELPVSLCATHAWYHCLVGVISPLLVSGASD